MEVTSTGHALLCSRDPALIEAVEVTAAALQVPLQVARGLDEARAGWGAASVRLIGTEVASRWPLATTGSAHLIGRSHADLARCSAELGLPVLPLPDDTGRLADALARAVIDRAPRGQVVAVVGASGGLGASTLAASLAMVAAQGNARAVAVELAHCGGGLDLLVGAETVPGLRWSDLVGARGELGDVVSQLPEVRGARVLAQSRETHAEPGRDALAAVVGSLSRSADAVVVDVGRSSPPVEADQVLLLVGADVRSVAAARALAEDAAMRPTGIVLRGGPGRTLPASVVARSLGAPCLGEIGHHRALPRLCELGLSPLEPPARRYRRQVHALWKRLSDAG